MTQEELLQEISAKIQAGRAKIVKELVQQAIDEGIPAQQILEEGLLAGLNVIGVKFKNNEVFVPEVLISARAMNQGVSILKPLLAQSEAKVSGRVCIGTVKGDLHDIGKNLCWKGKDWMSSTWESMLLRKHSSRQPLTRTARSSCALRS